jgi:hypothetical protein
MKTTINRYDFVEAFRACGRETQFTRPALFALFDYLEDYEDSCGVELELDPIGICCDWAEYPSALAAAHETGFEFVDGPDTEEAALEYLREHTQVIEFRSGVLVRNF